MLRVLPPRLEGDRTMPLLNWLIRPLLLLSAVIAGWFVAEDAVNFGVVQMAVAVVLIAAVVALAAFWEVLVDWFRGPDDEEARKE
jgi:hypothetical protein